MSRWRDLLIVHNESQGRVDFPMSERPETLLVVSAAAGTRWLAESIRGRELRYVFDQAGATRGDPVLRSVIESRLRAPGYKLYTMLWPAEILDAAREPMPADR